MYEVVQSFTSQSLGYLSAGRELSESDYRKLTVSERGKVQHKSQLLSQQDADDWYPPTGGSTSWSTDDTPSHNDSFSGFGGGESGGGGADSSWGGDSGGGDGGDGGD